jgi:hypothetical protein
MYQPKRLDVVLKSSWFALVPQPREGLGSINTGSLLQSDGSQLSTDAKAASLFPRVGYDTALTRDSFDRGLKLHSAVAVQGAERLTKHTGRMQPYQRNFHAELAAKQEHRGIANLSELNL